MQTVALMGLLALSLAGCNGNGPDPTTSPPPTTSAPPQATPTGRAFAASFDGLASGMVPQNWTAHRGTWGGQQDQLRGAGEAEPGLSSLVAQAAGTFRDFDLMVRFRMESGQHPQGAGVVFHFADDRNYQIIRYSISENGWHLFLVDDGNRDKQSDATVPGAASNPQFGDWVHLHVQSRNGHVVAHAGDVKVIEFDVPPTSSQVGRVGVFVRGDTLALFDDFAVSPA